MHEYVMRHADEILKFAAAILVPDMNADIGICALSVHAICAVTENPARSIRNPVCVVAGTIKNGNVEGLSYDDYDEETPESRKMIEDAVAIATAWQGQKEIPAREAILNAIRDIEPERLSRAADTMAYIYGKKEKGTLSGAFAEERARANEKRHVKRDAKRREMIENGTMRPLDAYELSPEDRAVWEAARAKMKAE